MGILTVLFYDESEHLSQYRVRDFSLRRHDRSVLETTEPPTEGEIDGSFPLR
jgi:hypothetical protein